VFRIFHDWILSQQRLEWIMDISQTIRLLGDQLGKVISELESPEIFDIEERIRAYAKARRAGNQTAAEQLLAEIAILNPDQGRAEASALATYS